MSWLTVWAAATLSALLSHPTGPAQWNIVLSALDSIRSTAFVQANTGLLDKVYVAESELLHHDRAVLASYTARGLSIQQMTMHLHRVQVVDRSAKRARLRVVDQLRPMTVRSADGESLALPADRPSRRAITLRFTPAGWRISAVQQQ